MKRTVALLCTLILSTCSWLTAAGEDPIQVTGLVFEDANGNGLRDAGEPGIAGVPVTEGVGFVTTDGEGRFLLSLQPDPVKRHGEPHVISISVPASHAPSGPWFEVLPPGGKGPFEFALRRSEVSLPFTWIHGTDCHVPRAGKEKFIDFRRDARERKSEARFCVLTGDLVDLSDSHSPGQALAEFTFFEEQIRDFPVPLYCIPGNHDIAGVKAPNTVWTPEMDGYAYNFYTRRVGPLRWSFNLADIHFVGLDFNAWTGTKWDWGVPASAVAWLAEDLARAPRGSRVCLFVHHHGKSEPLKAYLKEHPVDWIFIGHGHKVKTETWQGIPVYQSGSITKAGNTEEPLPGYRVVEMRKDGIHTEYVATGSVTGP